MSKEISWSEARTILKEMNFLVVTNVNGVTDKILGLEVYCAPIMKDAYVEEIKKVLPSSFKVSGNTNTLSIYITNDRLPS